jgi:DNA invertase Pin-like site-specific DNA recombinase
MSKEHSIKAAAAALRVADYARVSDDDQTSIPEQNEWARSVAISQGLGLVRSFADHGIPGSEFDHRLELQALLDFVKAEFYAGRRVDAVIVWDINRLSRDDSGGLWKILNELRDHGCYRLLTYDEGWIDLNDDTDRVMLNFRQDLQRAAFSRGLSRDVLRSMLTLAQQAVWISGSPPYGYRKGEGGRLVPGPAEEVEIVRWIFETYAARQISMAGLAALLNARKAGGLRWRADGVALILRRRTYCGDYVWNEQHWGKYHGVKGGKLEKATDLREREEERRRKKTRTLSPRRNAAADVLIVPDAHPAIVSRDLFALCESKRAANKVRKSPNGAGPVKPLAGLASCGHCGEPMWTLNRSQTKPKKGRKYTRLVVACSASRQQPPLCRADCCVRQDELLAAVGEKLKEAFAPGPARRALEAEVRTLADEQEGDLGRQRANLRGQLAALEKQAAEAADMILDAPAEHRDDLYRALARKKAELTRLRQQEDALSAPATAANVERLRLTAAALERFDRLIGGLAAAPPGEARDILNLLITKVTVHVEAPRDRAALGRRNRLRAELKTVVIEAHPCIAPLLHEALHTPQESNTSELAVRLVWQRRD